MGKTPQESLSTGRRSCSSKVAILSQNWLRLDCLPPSGGSGMKGSQKLELPPSKKDDLKAPAKKSGTTVKKEKPKQLPPKVKGAELWRECPEEFLAAAQAGMVSGRIALRQSGAELPHNVEEPAHSELEISHSEISACTSIPGPGLILKKIEDRGPNNREKESSPVMGDDKSLNPPANRRRKSSSLEEETSKIPSQDGNARIKPSQSGPQRKGKRK